MIIRKAPPRQLRLGEPIRHADAHKRPVTRRDFLAQGFLAGSATVIAPTIFSLFANPRAAMAALRRTCRRSRPVRDRRARRGQDPVHLHRPRRRRQHGGLERADRRSGRSARLPDARPATARWACPATWCRALINPVTNTSFTDTRLGLAFHSDSAFLRGIMDRISPAHRRQHQRRGDRGALRERHRQQSAQPDVRDLSRGRRRRARDPDRLARVGLGRQLDGAGRR